MPKESVVYWILAFFLILGPLALFYHTPIIYAHLVAEDFAGEYTTAGAFAGAGLLFLYDALRASHRGRRAISVVMGLAAIAIAGEEVSWAQRQLGYLFGLEVPEWVRAENVQGEMNLHNLEAVGLSSRAYTLGSYLLLTWLALSTLLFATREELATRLSTAGVPLVPLRLVPVCVLPALYFLLGPVASPMR